MTGGQLEHGPDHEKVRFRRSEIVSLKAFPSASSPAARPLPRRLRARLVRWAGAALLAAFAIFAAACLVLYTVGVDAIGNERLALQAQRAITRLAGVDVDVRLGELRLGLGETSLFALEVRDAQIARAEDGAPIARAGTLRFGLKAVPLLNGRVEISQIKLADAELSPAELPFAAAGAGQAMTPEDVHRAVFGAVSRAFRATDASGLRRVVLDNVALHMGEGQAVPNMTVERLELRRVLRTQIRFDGSAYLNGRGFSFDGGAERNAGTGSIEDFRFDILSPNWEQAASEDTRGGLRSLGTIELLVSGHQANAEDPGWLSFDMRAEDAVVGIDQDELPIARMATRVAFTGKDKIFSLVSSQAFAAGTRINFEGAVTPTTGDGRKPVYRFDLVSRESVLAPSDSPEPALPFAMRLSGRYEPSASRLTAESIELRTAGGELTASASLTMPAGMSPGVRLAVYVEDLPTAHAKQFWPWFAASGARDWTLAHVFGGRVQESNLRLNVPPGRLGNGIPLSREEVVGRFALSDTRFDIAGDIPPVRDGTGWVEFRGTDVSIGLSAGTIYMPSGRTVTTGGGSLVINAAHLTPRIGKLEIDIAGDASAMAELASYEPIAAPRLYGLAPDDLTGRTSGRVRADIPLQAGIPAENLDWQVALDFSALTVAKPLEGHEIAKAKGTLQIEPDRAEFKAEAELNAVPASLHIVEPLRGSAVERVRHVELTVNDAARDRLFPGLGTLVSGPFKIVYDEQPDKRRKVTASLDGARLSVPWIGWQKGPGIPASASFFMKDEDGTVELSEFAVRGESFAVDGSVRLSDGRLREAKLDRVQLSRHDDYAAVIRETGNGYAVSVNGRSFDARALIKQVLGDADAAGDGEGAGGGTGITLEASLARVHGFNGESVEQVEVTYSTDGVQPGRLSARGATSGHGSIQLATGIEQGLWTIRVSASNAGAALRFSDIYKHVEAGRLMVALSGPDEKNLSGPVEIRDFWVVDESRLGSLVAASTRQSANGKVDASRVEFERAAVILSKRNGRLSVQNGVLRGPLIGSTFQGTLQDADDSMSITGTFMPLYGLNRIFGEIPLFGQILGNGRDRGLIGITYRLTGKVGQPALEINPISAIAPGIFRQIFEYR